MLVVEDSPADVVLVRLAIEDSGVPLDIVHFSDGEEMIQHLNSASPKDTSFILLDLNIPKANGIDILKYKSTIDKWRHVPVILYSSSTRQEDIQQVIANGANAYVCKSVDFQQFSRTLNHLIVFWGEMNLPIHN